MDNSQEVFSGKSFDDLMKTIYENSTRKNQKLDQLANALMDLSKREGAEKEDIMFIYPMIKNMIDSSIKNDETLLKLATIFQRIKVAELRETGDDGWLNEEAIARLKQEATDMVDELKSTSGIEDAEDIQDMLDSLENDEENDK